MRIARGRHIHQGPRIQYRPSLLQKTNRLHTTLCIFLSITLLKELRRALLAAGWSDDATILVVQKASWGEEKIA